MHKRGISHRDIKLENMLFTGDDYTLKFCDLGLSASFLDDSNKKKNRRTKTLQRHTAFADYCNYWTKEGFAGFAVVSLRNGAPLCPSGQHGCPRYF